MASNDEEFKKRIVRMHLEEGRTIRSLSEEYHVSENGNRYWLKNYREECSKDPAAKEEYDLMKETLKLRKEIEETNAKAFPANDCSAEKQGHQYQRNYLPQVHEYGTWSVFRDPQAQAGLPQRGCPQGF